MFKSLKKYVAMVLAVAILMGVAVGVKASTQTVQTPQPGAEIESMLITLVPPQAWG